MTITFNERFRQDIPDTTKVSGIYIDRANSNWRNPSSYVVAFNVKGLGTIPYRVPVAEAMLVAKSRIKDFDNVSVTISGRASPVIERNKTITGLLGLKAQFQRKNSNGVHEYRKSKTISAKGCDIHI